MFQPRTVVLPLVLLSCLVQPTTARAQGQLRLWACNKGTVPVQVIVAHAQGTFVYSWVVNGKTIAPGWCEEFPEQSGEALLAFGAKDSLGRFVSLKATSVPDLGDRASKPAECPQLSLPGVASLAAISTSYYFSVPRGARSPYYSDWGDRGRLCFAWSGNIRCANIGGLDFDATSFTDGGVLFHCRGEGGCAFIAAPWKPSDGAKVRLDGRHWTLSTPQRSLFVSHLPNQQAARTLAARLREAGEIWAKYAAK